MADVGVQYVLTTPGPTITFNQFTDPFTGQDQYYITEIRGLAAPALRTPFDSVPLGDGGLIHDFWFGPRHIGVEGTILVQSTEVMDDIVLARNQMEKDLTDALNSILRADGTFAFTPNGQAAVSYTVRYEVALEFVHSNNYLQLDFSFGLIAGNPNP
jgi:hypothetical protein